MTSIGWIQIALYCAVVIALTKPLGLYMTRVFTGERTFLSPVLRPIERVLYRVSGIDEAQEQTWVAYLVSMVFLHVGGFLILYTLLRLQDVLPFNPAGQSAVSPDLAFNTSTSFITNTNWQSYGGESTLSYLSQMLGLTHQNFLSAATGIALAVALIRGFARASSKTVGSFWVDLTRGTLYVLLPICIPFTLYLVWSGIPQTLGAYVDATTLEGAKQTIALGPVASQVAIKMLGTNGGGFFNANAAHPFENPTAVCNFVQMISIFAIGAALTNVFGRMVGDERRAGRSSARWASCSWPASPCSTARKRPATRCCTPSASRAATWKARKSASASPPRRSSPPSPPLPPAAPSTPCTTASRRSAA